MQRREFANYLRTRCPDEALTGPRLWITRIRFLRSGRLLIASSEQCRFFRAFYFLCSIVVIPAVKKEKRFGDGRYQGTAIFRLVAVDSHQHTKRIWVHQSRELASWLIL